ncbi:hypothetical protein Q8W90_28385 [Pseudomonas aeruginosa]|uniref:hypothetical protein n=1 Tax=Pseudomonas aeruginosa TaxID=287 RepID=UPI001AE03EB3|nr:hypothetical protein [Pseudomonas aeruginosa]MDU0686151.1 hypothetical protein [Pseudomonas aeruginosa]
MVGAQKTWYDYSPCRAGVVACHLLLEVDQLLQMLAIEVDQAMAREDSQVAAGAGVNLFFTM